MDDASEIMLKVVGGAHKGGLQGPCEKGCNGDIGVRIRDYIRYFSTTCIPSPLFEKPRHAHLGCRV